ncbi:hypothetical protein B484DRAFT_425628 [Ochromonadaceae sp. CCMP2298]|nr:hypothetical protein B484DRAFT_425628 [Ochromonadaceae sp. CCMP2298]
MESHTEPTPPNSASRHPLWSAATNRLDSGAMQRSAASSPKGSPRGRCNRGASDRL